MPGGLISATMAVVLFVGMMGVVFGLILPALVRASWGRWHQVFPAGPPAPGAVTKRCQSFSVGLLNLGYGVHVSVDQEHLHLTPTLLCRGFGLRPVSVPWDAVQVVGAFPFGRRRALIAGVKVIGPAWCLDVAAGRAP